MACARVLIRDHSHQHVHSLAHSHTHHLCRPSCSWYSFTDFCANAPSVIPQVCTSLVTIPSPSRRRIVLIARPCLGLTQRSAVRVPPPLAHQMPRAERATYFLDTTPESNIQSPEDAKLPFFTRQLQASQ